MIKNLATEIQSEEQGKRRRRWWIYVLVIGICLWIFSEWFLGVAIPQEPASFEGLSRELNHHDSNFTKYWRKVWPKLPGIVTANMSRFAPGPPAVLGRIHACRKMAQFDSRAVPLLIDKLSDPDDRVILEALNSLLGIGIGTDQTFISLSSMVENKNHTISFRQVVLLTLVGLHSEEESLYQFLHQLAQSDDAALNSMIPPKVGLMNFPINMSSWGFAYGVTVNERLKPAFYEMLLTSKDRDLILFAFYLLQRNNPHVMQMGDAISETLSIPDPLVKEHAFEFLKAIRVDPNRFSPNHPIKLKFLALKLRRPTRQIEKWLISNLSESTVRRLHRGSPAMLHMEANFYHGLITELNRMIRGDLIYDPQRFSDIPLRPETRRLLSMNPQGPDLNRLNKLLLEDAFPGALIPSD